MFTAFLFANHVYGLLAMSDVPSLGTLNRNAAPPWENADRYVKSSVLSYVENVTTPTFLATREEDFLHAHLRGQAL